MSELIKAKLLKVSNILIMFQAYYYVWYDIIDKHINDFKATKQIIKITSGKLKRVR